MTTNITLYLLIKDNNIIFGPRRYHKPAFLKALIDNGVELELPESVDAMTSLADGYSLVPEHEVATVLQTKVVEVEPEPEVVVEAIANDEEIVEEVNKVTRKKKNNGSSNNQTTV